jgi:hypothetical protein
MEIGAQQLANSFLDSREELSCLAALFGVTTPCPLSQAMATHVVHGGLEHLDANAQRSVDFWRWLGFKYASIDIDGSPGSIPLDLNYDDIPANERGKYQLVTNFGTTEHVANQLNAFKIIHELTAVGGLMVHHVPAQGMINHGLINYNPKFFWLLTRSNGYKLLHLNFFSDSSAYGLPSNVLDGIRVFDPAAPDRLNHYKTTDCYLLIVLRKRYDLPFIPPLDVNTGTRTENAQLNERYWTVFNQAAFRRYRLKMLARSFFATLKQRTGYSSL